MDKAIILAALVLAVLVFSEWGESKNPEDTSVAMVRNLTPSEDVPTFFKGARGNNEAKISDGRFEKKKIIFACAHDSSHPNASISVMRTMNPVMCSFYGEGSELKDNLPESFRVAGYIDQQGMIEALKRAEAPSISGNFDLLCRQYIEYKACYR